MPIERRDIDAAFEEIYMLTAGEDMPELTDDLVLLESGMDSIGFASLVSLLEERHGVDPFAANSEAYYPQTYGEFVKFYKDNS